MKPLPAPRQRAGGLLSWLDELYEFVKAARPIRSETCEVHETPEGTQIIPFRGGGTAASAFAGEDVRPGTLYQDVKDGRPVLGMTWTTVAGQQPEGFRAGGLPPFTMTVPVGSSFVFVTGFGNPRSLLWTGAKVSLSRSFTMRNTPGSVSVLVGSVNATSEQGTLSLAIAQVRYGPFDMEICSLAL